eukprot:Seg983.3 transcript_id=Seg983.3/GoldUCD/mRNA.D3Y31 product=Fibroleukin protein_id=Seg983.3/GoldUCD/D3Y31
MLKFIAIFSLLKTVSTQLQFAYMGQTIATIGTFFKQQDHQHIAGNLDENKPFLTQELFACGGKDSCSNVANEKLTKQTSAETNGAEADSWKKKPTAKSCKDHYAFGQRKSGIYLIQPFKNTVLEVFCDMETDGGGWMVVQRHVNGSTDFNRDWDAYKRGFGSLSGNLWYGLEAMHMLTGAGKNAVLRIEMKHLGFGNKLFYAKYETFEISSEADGYRLRSGQYSGNAGDALTSPGQVWNQNGRKFSTFDRDNDARSSGNCAASYQGGFWFGDCHLVHLNGVFPTAWSTDPQYMSWKTINAYYGNINFSEMKIKHS